MILIGRSFSFGFVYIGVGVFLFFDVKIFKFFRGMDMGVGEMVKVIFEFNDFSVGRGFSERELVNFSVR